MNFWVVEQMFIVGLAGALGAVSRYAVGRWVVERVNSQFPLATLLINVSGAFVIGLLFALTARALINPVLQTFLATGFLGGYTTFSTMSWEGVQIGRSGKHLAGLIYLMGSVLLGLGAVVVGMKSGGIL